MFCLYNGFFEDSRIWRKSSIELNDYSITKSLFTSRGIIFNIFNLCYNFLRIIRECDFLANEENNLIKQINSKCIDVELVNSTNIVNSWNIINPTIELRIFSFICTKRR